MTARHILARWERVAGALRASRYNTARMPVERIWLICLYLSEKPLTVAETARLINDPGKATRNAMEFLEKNELITHHSTVEGLPGVPAKRWFATAKMAEFLGLQSTPSQPS
jgi:predicted ArsR family transcriptional regulator